jgi:hypothetical protein
VRFNLALAALLTASAAFAGEAYLVIDAEIDHGTKPRTIGLTRSDGSPEVHVKAGQPIVDLEPAGYAIDHVHTGTAEHDPQRNARLWKNREEFSLSEPLAIEVPDGSIVFIGKLRIANVARDEYLVTLERDLNLLKAACAAKPELFQRLPVYMLDDASKLGAPIRLDCGG